MVKSFLEIAEKKGIAKGRTDALREVLKRLIARGMPLEKALAIVDLPEENKT